MLRAECIVGWQWTCQQWLDPVGKTEGKLNTVYKESGNTNTSRW